jgi:hypothetical protein
MFDVRERPLLVVERDVVVAGAGGRDELVVVLLVGKLDDRVRGRVVLDEVRAAQHLTSDDHRIAADVDHDPVEIRGPVIRARAPIRVSHERRHAPRIEADAEDLAAGVGLDHVPAVATR